jgi:hypothetical protein
VTLSRSTIWLNDTYRSMPDCALTVSGRYIIFTFLIPLLTLNAVIKSLHAKLSDEILLGILIL